MQNLEKQLLNEIDDIITNTKNNTKLSAIKDKTILVISGGSLKGISALGALKAFQELDCLNNIDTYAGSSIGSIICFLLMIKYSPNDLYDLMVKFEISKIKNINFNSLFNNFGIDDGKKLEIFLETLIQEKNLDKSMTLKDLYDLTKHKLYITTTCLNDKEVYYLSVDTHPNLSIIKALRMSSAIPIYFCPVIYDNKIYIDGGCIDNYPVDIFKDRTNDILGIFLNPERTKITDITKLNLQEYCLHVFDACMAGIARNTVKGHEEYTLQIKVKNISIINLSVVTQDKQDLFQSGYNSVFNLFSL